MHPTRDTTAVIFLLRLGRAGDAGRSTIAKLFGAPYKHGFLVEPDDPVNFKSLILECTCGITECWFLLARISVEKRIVKWDDFQQFHRDWRYQLAFTFDRGAYEKAFSATSHSL